MAKIRCTRCHGVVSAPLRRHIAKCGKCGTDLQINPERPFFNVFFLFALVMPFVAGYSTVWNGGWKFSDLVACASLFILPLVIYVVIIFFSGAKTVPASRRPPTLDAQRPGEPRSAVSQDVPRAKMDGTKNPGAPGWMVLSVLGVFLAWAYFYLVHVRPVMNAWLAQYISGYPAMFHLIPMLGVPIVFAVVLEKVAGRK